MFFFVRFIGSIRSYMNKYYKILEKKNIRIIAIALFIILVLNIEFTYDDSRWGGSCNYTVFTLCP